MKVRKQTASNLPGRNADRPADPLPAPPDPCGVGTAPNGHGDAGDWERSCVREGSSAARARSRAPVTCKSTAAKAGPADDVEEPVRSRRRIGPPGPDLAGPAAAWASRAGPVDTRPSA